MSRPLKSDAATVPAIVLTSYIFSTAFTVPYEYQYLYQSQSFFTGHIHLHIYPTVQPVGYTF